VVWTITGRLEFEIDPAQPHDRQDLAPAPGCGNRVAALLGRGDRLHGARWIGILAVR
jgi:hypothetical protein